MSEDSSKRATGGEPYASPTVEEITCDDAATETAAMTIKSPAPPPLR